MILLKEFLLFSSLPLEIRQKIWHYSLPGPRALLITRNTAQAQAPPLLSKILFSIFKHPSSRRPSSKYVVAAASYSGKQPVILSVSHESRVEALCHLTPLLGIYWNLHINMPYFELPVPAGNDSSEHAVILIQEMRSAGKLDVFRGIAIDWVLWERYRALMARDRALSGNDHP
jgi:hypothetical protein